MGLFGRRKEQNVDVDALVAQALTERGIAFEVLAPGDFSLELGDGRSRLSTQTFAARHAGTPPERMADAAREFVAAVVRPPSASPLADVAELIRPRATPLDAMPGEAGRRLALEKGIALSDDMVVLASIDRPDAVETITDIERYGGWDALWPLAIGNLRAQPHPEGQWANESAGPQARVLVFAAQDFFVASRVLILDDLLARVGLAAPHGALVAMPNRHVLAVHPLAGPGANAALAFLLQLAASTPPAANGPTLSSQVHYRAPDGALQPVAHVSPEGRGVHWAEGAYQRARAEVGTDAQG